MNEEHHHRGKMDWLDDRRRDEKPLKLVAGRDEE